MGGKFSPIIIVVLLAVVIGIIFVAYEVILSTDNTNKPKSGAEDIVDIKPVLLLSKGDLNNNNTITITASAKTEDESGIDYITLPDGTEVSGSEATFDADENKSYTFSVTGINGETSTVEIVVTEIPEASIDNPYMPEGFEYLGGDVETGYVIEDKYGNQYVWVPVEKGKLTRGTQLEKAYDENNSSAAALVNSVAKYYGFYIGRFEASSYDLDGKTVAASMSGKVPWTNISCLDAIDYASKSGEDFGYGDSISTSLINSYAWDTAIAWIEKEYESYGTSTTFGNYGDTILPTGMTEKDRLKNICDLSGNVREWTTEKYTSEDTETTNNKKKNNKKDTEQIVYRVVRGGSATLSRTPSAHIGYQETTSDLYWGFRMILYKQ